MERENPLQGASEDDGKNNQFKFKTNIVYMANLIQAKSKKQDPVSNN